jgi:hypothetical protein
MKMDRNILVHQNRSYFPHVFKSSDGDLYLRMINMKNPERIKFQKFSIKSLAHISGLKQQELSLLLNNE